MNRLNTVTLLVGIAIALVWWYFQRGDIDKTSVRTSHGDIPIADAEVSVDMEVSNNFEFSSAALNKLDPVLLRRMEMYFASGEAQKHSANWNAMIVLNIPAGLQETLANAFDQDPVNSSGNVYNDQSSNRAATDSELNATYAKRKSALKLQEEILENFTDGFLSDHPRLGKENIESQLRLAPMISIKATPEVILALADSDAVRHVGADTPAEKAIERVAMEARFAHAWNSDFLDGTGVKVALLEEYDVPFSNLVGPGKPIKSPVAIYDPDSVSDHEHSSNTAAVLWGQDPFFRGLALGSSPYFATAETTTGRAAATDWCIQQGCSVISMSWGSPAGENDGNLKWFDLYYDWVTEINRVLVVAAAGNDGNEAGRVIHPGAAFNVLTVGALDGKDPNTWSDDVVASFSSHVDPNTGTMKPEVVCYGTNIKAAGVAPAFSTLSSGTSYATPAVAAAAALCIQENPDSADEPMLLKAQLMASGVAHDFAGTDRDGVGTVLAQAYNAATSARTISRTGIENLEWSVSLAGGRKNRIVLCYPHRPTTSGTPNSGSAVDNSNSYHQIDFDLELWVGGSKVAQSDFGINNPFEVIDYTPGSDTTATVRIARFDWKASDPRDSVRVGLAHGSDLNFGTGPDDSNDDSYEPNDSPGEAKTLSLAANLTEMRSTDEDWFRLDVPAHTTTKVRIDLDNDIGDLDLAASRVDDSSVTVASISENDFESITLTSSSEARSWWVRVFPFSPTVDRNSYSLKVESDLPLQPPSPITPAHGSETTTEPRLACSAPTTYSEDSNARPHSATRWQISGNAQFTSILLDQTTASPTEFFVPAATLTGGQNYHWRVRHIDSDNRPGPWSASFHFTTATGGAGPPDTVGGLTQQWIGSDLRLTWNILPDAESYTVYKRVGGSDTKIGTTSSAEFLIGDLVAGERYSYRVTATESGVEGSGTEVTVIAPEARIDGMIGTSAGRLKGNGVINSNGKGQRVFIRLPGRRIARIFFSARNASQLRSHLHFQMNYNRRNLKVKVRKRTGGLQNVTAAMRSGYLASSVPPDTSILFDARIRAKAPNGPTRQALRIHNTAVSSSNEPLARDVTMTKMVQQ